MRITDTTLRLYVKESKFTEKESIYLMCDLEPNSLLEVNERNEKERMLKILRKELRYAYQAFLARTKPENQWEIKSEVHYSREDLVRVAEAYDLKPRFLFLSDTHEEKSNYLWPWGNHETELLKMLAQAARKFWVNYDPLDSSTAPTNEQVSKWLEDQGIPNRKAEVMAQMLRADGLPSGPRK